MKPAEIRGGLKIFYLMLISVLSFQLNDLWLIFLLLVQFPFLYFSEKRLYNFFRAIVAPIPFFISVILFYTIFVKGGREWRTLFIPFYENGLKEGLWISLRIYILIIGTSVLRVGDKKDISSFAKKIGFSQRVALLLENISFNKEKGGFNFGKYIRDMLRGDVGEFVEILKKKREEARKNFGEGVSEEVAEDVSLISALSIVYFLSGLISLFPGLPFAPGYKGVLIIPLYMIASSYSKGRYGGTILGGIMGFISVLTGGKRFGIFVFFREFLPGIISDLINHTLGLRRGKVFLLFFGAIMGLFRFSIFFLLSLIMKVPDFYYALLLPFALSNIVFGGIGGIVGFYILRALSESK